MRDGIAAPRLVLVVDDDDDLREAIAEALELSGYRTARARDGSDALMLLGADGELPGVILLDLMMPRMSGQQLLERLRRDPRLAAIRVVVVTASTHVDVDGLSADAVLRKPVGMASLLATLGTIGTA